MSATDCLVCVILPRVGRVGSIRPLILVKRIKRISVKLGIWKAAKLVITFGGGGSIRTAQSSR